MPGGPVDIARIIDESPLSRGQLGTFILCGLIAMVDGFDLQIAGSLAPTLSDVLRVPVVKFGLVFAAGFFGIMVGSLALGQIADHTGHKAMVVTALMIAGIFTAVVPVLAAAGWLRLDTLVISRFLAGLGVGGVMPNVLALTAEYAPQRSRALIVNTMYCGVPLGSVMVGLVTAILAPVMGWQVTFEVGAVATLALAFLSALALPESARFLVVRGAPMARVSGLLRRMLPSATASLDAGAMAGFTLAEARVGRPLLRQLTGGGRALPTLLLWSVLFLNLLMIVLVLSWLPAVMRQAGLQIRVGVLLAALFSLGGIAGSMLVGRTIDRLGTPRVLIAVYLAAALAVARYGLACESVWTLYAVTLAAGATVIGAQSGITAMVASFYLTAMRSTGLGSALGIGRIGSIVGPALGSVMLSYNWSVMGIFLAAAVPAVVAALVISALPAFSPQLAASAA